MKKIIIGIMACSLSLSAFAFGRDGDVDYLVNSYKEKLDEVKKSESKKEADKQKAISDAQGSIDNYQDSIKAYNKSIKKYEKKYLEPARIKIEKQRKQADNYRNKIAEYKKGLDQAVKEQRFDSRGALGAIGGSKYGAADFKDLLEDSESSLVEAEKLEASYKSSLKQYEEKKKSYEAVKLKKLKDVEAAKGVFGQAEEKMKAFRAESKETVSSSEVPTLNAVVGQMIQRSKNGSLEADMLLRDLDNLATKMGVSRQDLQNVFTSNPELREKLGNTAIGGYVNSQIASAMGSVCEYQNMCAAKSAEDLKGFQPEIVKKSLEHLYDKNRGAGVVKALGENPVRDISSEPDTSLGK